MNQKLTVEYYGDWGNKSKTIIMAGVIDEKAKTVFTQGQCHAFALVINKLTGWPIYGFYSASEDPPYDTPFHTVVKSTKGYFDIEGTYAHTRHSPIDKILVLTTKQVMDFQRIDYLKPDLKAAKTFAIPALQKYFSITKNNILPDGRIMIKG